MSDEKPLSETRPQSEFFKESEPVRINPETGSMHIPGVGSSSLVGVDRKHLQEKQREHAQRMALLRRQMRSDWQCLKCKRIWPGFRVRATLQTEHGVQMEVLKCPDTNCDGPVILHRDALSLTKPPKGAVEL